ncbi:MAG TPA: LapA family protein [Flavobacteriales bacterium]|nr:LapA family protein [Flavobacteriales bacterium]
MSTTPEIPQTPTVPPIPKGEKEPGFFSENKKLIYTAIVIVLMLVFIFENLHEVGFWLLVFPVHLPMVIVILLFFSIGAVWVWITSYFAKKELRKKIKNLESRLKKYETL